MENRIIPEFNEYTSRKMKTLVEKFASLLYNSYTFSRNLGEIKKMK